MAADLRSLPPVLIVINWGYLPVGRKVAVVHSVVTNLFNDAQCYTYRKCV